MGSVLVTGGAGYIGSHACLALLEAGYDVVVVDDLSTGVRRLVPDAAVFVRGDVGDPALMARVLGEHGVDAVMHFAGSVVVPESVTDPLKYYRNNTCASRSLIESCLAAGVHRFIFSSTAAVYGNPPELPVTEATPTAPESPYGLSKLMTEWILRDTAAASPLRYMALRYFNVAGADPQGRTGQATPQATHLIKVACEAACGKRDVFTIFGDDYDTPDGTGVRDFIHVSDLADIHVRALRRLEQGGDSAVANCGYGRGFSVREVVATLERVCGSKLPVRTGPRRDGDVGAVYTATDRLHRLLDWSPRYDSLETIVRAAYEWERAQA